MKSYPVKTTIETCTFVRLKGMKILTTHRTYIGLSEKYVTQILILK